MFETVFVNIYGHTAQQWRPDPGWRRKYEQYLTGHDEAIDKCAFNAKLFPDPNRDLRDEGLAK